jgi:hypothetical protein
VSDCFTLPEFDDLMLDAETCCTGDCKLTFAPLTNTNESTALTDRENGASYHLDRQNVSCLSDPISAFVMETGSGGQMRYEIQCAKGADLDLVQVLC